MLEQTAKEEEEEEKQEKEVGEDCTVNYELLHKVSAS